jgi:hypothetical protein
MPVKEREPLEPAKRLAEFDGQVISITAEPLKEIETDYGASFLATLASGGKVWLSQAVVNQFEGGHAGNYEVYSYKSHGKTCFGLRNAQ